MKSLSLSSPMVIMVVGLPGAGKSFFARQFAATFGAPLVSDDKIRTMLFANHNYGRDENAMVSQVAGMMTEQLFAAGKTFVLDGGYNAKVARDEMARMANEHGFRTLTIWAQTDEPTCRRRSQKRDSKRDDDRYSQALTPEMFDQLAKKFTQPIVNDSTVVISGKHTYATQARVVLKKIVASRDDLRKPVQTTPRQEKPGRVFVS